MSPRLSAPSTDPEARLAILHERRVELAFKNQRWFDLPRAFAPQELAAYLRAKN